jgi:hypothetical protein
VFRGWQPRGWPSAGALLDWRRLRSCHHGQALYRRISGSSCRGGPASWMRALAVGAAAIALVTGFIALVAWPNSWASMTDHLGRVVHLTAKCLGGNARARACTGLGGHRRAGTAYEEHRPLFDVPLLSTLFVSLLMAAVFLHRNTRAWLGVVSRAAWESWRCSRLCLPDVLRNLEVFGSPIAPLG